MFNTIHSILNQELFKKHLCNLRIPKETVPHAPVISIIIRMKSEVSTTLRCWLCSTCYTAVRIKNRSKSTSANKIATMKNTDNVHCEGKLSRVTTKLTLFTVSKDEWDTKEDTGKSMKNTLYVMRYAKRNLGPKRRRTVKKSNPYYRVMLV